MGSETANLLCELIDSNLATFLKSINAVEDHLTFVTNYSATLPAIFRALESPNRVAFSEL